MNKRIFFTELGGVLWKVVRFCIILGLSYVLMHPVFYMMVQSVKDANQVLDPSIVWVPKQIVWSNFEFVIQEMKYWSSLTTSLTVSLVSSVLQLVSCSMVGYGFARYKFKGSGFLFLLAIITLIMPAELITIPLRFLYQNFSIPIISPILDLFYRQAMPEYLTVNFIDSWFVFWMPAMLATGIRSGLYIFIFRQFFSASPKELEEAAMVDGAGHFKIFYSVMVPNASGSYLTVFLFSFVWYWNDTFYSKHFIAEKSTLAKMLQGLKSSIEAQGVTDMFNQTPYLMAGALMFIIPMIVMYAILQRYFVESVDRSGLVG